jgi:HEAT repeat protein
LESIAQLVGWGDWGDRRKTEKLRQKAEREDAMRLEEYRLRNGDELERREAAIALGRVGEEAKFATPTLLKGLSDNSVPVVREVVLALGKMGTAATPAIPVMEKLAAHDDPQIRERAKAALRQIRGN